MTSSIALGNAEAGALELRLPDIAYTKSGIAFYPNDDVWEWTDGPFRLYLNFCKIKLPAGFSRDSLKHALLVFAKKDSPSHVANLFNVFLHFLTQRPSSPPLISVSAAEVSNYAARLEENQKWRIGTLNVLLQQWVKLGLLGVEKECAQYLRERRKPGNTKGKAVRIRDPINGPFSEAEYTALYKAVDAAYGAGEVEQWVATLTRLLFACGGRISQYASLKVMDFVENGDKFLLSLPQVKTREMHSRVLLKQFDLSPQTGRLVKEHIEILKLTGNDERSALFPAAFVMRRGLQASRSETDLFYGHCTGAALSRVLSAALGPIAPPSERLQFEPIPITPKRFRYTFATRLAEEGASKAVIADRLGHVDLQNVDVYFEASPKIVENIDKAMDVQLAPLARAFRGRLVEDQEHSTHQGAPGSRIIDFRVSRAPVGSCGSKGQGCAFIKPIACYTCFKFEPWLDAPHEKVLLRLRAEQQRWASDGRMAAINDDAILAVQQVIAECDQVRQQRASGTGVGV